jgi:hypothetical protein
MLWVELADILIANRPKPSCAVKAQSGDTSASFSPRIRHTDHLNRAHTRQTYK